MSPFVHITGARTQETKWFSRPWYASGGQIGHGHLAAQLASICGVEGLNRDKDPLFTLLRAYFCQLKRHIAPVYGYVTWYDRGYLVGVYGGWTPHNLIFYYLYDGDDEMVRLDGKALGLHGFNARNPLKINESTVLPYLWFFTFFVRGDDGPFLLAQNANDRFLPKELED